MHVETRLGHLIPRNTVRALKPSIKIISPVEKIHSNSLTDDFMYIYIVWRLSWKLFSHIHKTKQISLTLWSTYM